MFDICLLTKKFVLM
jgi:hypothetical protein